MTEAEREQYDDGDGNLLGFVSEGNNEIRIRDNRFMPQSWEFLDNLCEVEVCRAAVDADTILIRVGSHSRHNPDWGKTVTLTLSRAGARQLADLLTRFASVDTATK